MSQHVGIYVFRAFSVLLLVGAGYLYVDQLKPESLIGEAHFRLEEDRMRRDTWCYEIVPGVYAEHVVQTTRDEAEDEASFAALHRARVEMDIKLYPPVNK